MTIADYLGSLRTFWDYPGLSETIWDHLGLFGTSIWDYLGLSWTWVQVKTGECKLLLFETFSFLFFFTRAIPRGARAPKNIEKGVQLKGSKNPPKGEYQSVNL